MNTLMFDILIGIILVVFVGYVATEYFKDDS